LAVHVSSDNRGSALIQVRGELDFASVEKFLTTVGELVHDRASRRVILGFDELEFIDARGIHALICIADLLAARNRSLVVLHPSRMARRVLALCGLHHLVLDPEG
jgi:anti-anti-sigma factor